MATRNQEVDDEAFEGLNGDPQGEVATRTDDLLDAPPVTAADSVMSLASTLPKWEEVVEVDDEDTSPLTDKEQEQKEKTEDVILAAHQAGKAAIWVMGQGFANASRGKWFRTTHPSLEAYMADLVPDVVPRQARRWATGSKLALAITARTGEAPVEGQVRELTRAKGKEKKTLPHDVAEDLYVATVTVAKEIGKKVTAQTLEKFRATVEDQDLPAATEDRQEKLQEWVRSLLAGPIGPDSFDGKSNGEQEGDDVEDAEIVETPQLDALDQALTSLKEARKTIKRPTFEAAIDEGHHDRYRQLVEQLRTLTEELKTAAGRAPWPAVPVPAQPSEQEPAGAAV